MSKQGYTVRLPANISPEADELIRSRCRRKGDLSRLTDAAIKLAYGPKNVVAESAPDLDHLGDNPT